MNNFIIEIRDNIEKENVENSDTEEDFVFSISDDDELDDSHFLLTAGQLKELDLYKLNYKQVEDKINKYYFDINHNYSSSLDILASYLKGQKIIYMEAKYECEKKLNLLMMPAILLSTVATILTTFIYRFSLGTYILCGINGLVSFLLTLIGILEHALFQSS
jgi:hypothetical protein